MAEQYGIETRNHIAYGDNGMDPALWARFAELGAIGALFPEADGGFGGAGFDVAVVFEALGSGLVVEPFWAHWWWAGRWAWRAAQRKRNTSPASSTAAPW